MSNIAGKMEAAGKTVAEILDALHDFIKPGISTLDIDIFCANYMKKIGVTSGSLGHGGFPNYVCVSLNHKICHGVPSATEILQPGDLVSVDIVNNLNGYFGDACLTYVVGGHTTKTREKLVKACFESMWSAISLIKNGLMICELGRAIENTAASFGFKSVRDFCSHGIGDKVHKDPRIPGYYDKRSTYVLKTGDFITIEPMIVEKEYYLTIDKDKFTAITLDGGDCAHTEHTIAVLDSGYSVLTYNRVDKQHNKIQKNC